ncbi:MAG: phosphoribosylanthranilate isomerase [Bacteroidota bacterium]
MKHNTLEVSQLHPDYLGFIFYEHSPRNFEGTIPEIPSAIKKVGVFVNASESFVLETVNSRGLDIVQLHGEESPDYCRSLMAGFAKDGTEVKLWKVFSIKETFDTQLLTPYVSLVDKFLFDTKDVLKGGTGRTFNWKALECYEIPTPIVLSGGIGLEQVNALKRFLEMGLPIEVIDVNSKFEFEPGHKDVSKLRQFVAELGLPKK